MRRKLNGKEKIIAAVKRMINGASEICLKSFPILNSVGYELKYSAVKNAEHTKRIIRKLIRISFFMYDSLFLKYFKDYIFSI